MIIYSFSPSDIKSYFLKMFKYNLKVAINEKRPLLKEILSNYKDWEIDEFLEDSFTIVGNNIFMNTSGRAGQFLRALQYGTGRTKSYNLVIETLNKTIKEVRR